MTETLLERTLKSALLAGASFAILAGTAYAQEPATAPAAEPAAATDAAAGEEEVVVVGVRASEQEIDKRGVGDNFNAARTMGIPVRPLIVAAFIASALLAWLAGVASAVSLQSMNTRLVNSALLYDVVLVVVIGGIGLSGGKGGMRNVVVGAALIGVLLNGMTILNLPNIHQNLIKALILLGAIILDGRLNPRDEQTSQQGDI